MNPKDDNGSPVIYGVSHIDGLTLVQVTFDPITRVMGVDTVTTIQFDPLINASQTPNGVPIAKATSSSDNKTTRPWVVHATTGKVLIST